MRGKSQKNEIARQIAYVHGRIEHKVQVFDSRLKQEVEAFADSIGAPRELFTEGVGQLLPAVGQWGSNPVPRMRVSAPKGIKLGRPVEATGHTQEHPKPSVTKPNKQKFYWAKMTPEQRSAEMARRRKKWSPEALAKWSHKGRRTREAK